MVDTILDLSKGKGGSLYCRIKMLCPCCQNRVYMFSPNELNNIGNSNLTAMLNLSIEFHQKQIGMDADWFIREELERNE